MIAARGRKIKQAPSPPPSRRRRSAGARFRGRRTGRCCSAPATCSTGRAGSSRAGPSAALVGPEGDGLDPAALGAVQGAADMPLAHRLGVAHAHAGERKARQRVAGAERPGALDHVDQFRASPPPAPGPHRCPARAPAGAAPSCGAIRSSRKRVELGQRIARHGQARRHGMAAAIDQQARPGAPRSRPRRDRRRAPSGPSPCPARRPCRSRRPAGRSARPGGWRRCRSRRHASPRSRPAAPTAGPCGRRRTGPRSARSPGRAPRARWRGARR